MTLADIITGKEYTINEKTNGRKELVANEGFWITDSVLYETSDFVKKITTKLPEQFGTVSDEEKEMAETIIAGIQAAMLYEIEEG